MPVDHVLLFTDVVDSTRITEELGDEAASKLWAAHDQIARGLLANCSGREIDKSDGFLLLFERVDHAVTFALALHASLSHLRPPLRTRVGIHSSPMIVRTNTSQEIDLGAKPLELDGRGKALASRLMSLARGGQTLLSASARSLLPSDAPLRVRTHGYWRLKGVTDPIEVFEVGDDRAEFIPPPDEAKAYRVLRTNDGWMPLADLHHGLPAERDAFVGRASELQTLAAHLDEVDLRLVTLLGVGGIGKTRLALRYARYWLGNYPGGAWFSDLSSATSLDGIVHAVAQGMDVPLGKGDPVQQLGAAIDGRGECLVILDNFEQVARHAESTIGVWMTRAPRARFLVTSREVLGIVGEHTHTVAQLTLPEAVTLFELRSRAVMERPLSSITERDALTRLVELLDRLPLAIELAAARVRVMSVSAMLGRMGERFKLLVTQGGRRDRQATLRATLDWSWDLLSPDEQSVLSQLSVFEGGFTLESAEAVVALPEQSVRDWVPDALQGLVEKSLVRRERDTRFGLLRSVQEYAAERLDKADSSMASGMPARAAVQRRHARHFADAGEARATADHCADLENMYVACRRSVTEDRVAAVDALQAFWHALRLTGPFRAALDLVAGIEAIPDLTDGERAVVNRVAGAALYLLGDMSGASRRYSSSLALAASSGLELERADSLCLMAELAMARGQLGDAQSMLDEALASADKHQSDVLRLRAMSGLGALNLRRSRLDAARLCYQQAMSHAQGLFDRRRLGGLHGNLGLVDQLQGHPARAREHYGAALTMARDVGDRQWEGNTRCNLGLLLHELGDESAARVELEEALLIACSIGHRRLEATTLCNLGIIAYAQGTLQDALSSHRRAVEVARDLGDRRLLGQFLGYLGLALAAGSDVTGAHACFDEAEAVLSGLEDPAALALLHCQRASAAKYRGDEAERQHWFDKAEAALRITPAEPASELAAAFEDARLPAAPNGDDRAGFGTRGDAKTY